jgi:hypothetical protein
MAKQNKALISDAQITICLRGHLTGQRPVTLHNTYQGVPVHTEAEVAMVHAEFLGLIVHPYQAVCIKEARYTFIESKSLPQMIRAFPISIDYTNHVVLLKELKIPHAINVDLYHSWVAPEKPVGVEVHARDGLVHPAEMLGIAVLEDNRVRVVMSVDEDIPLTRLGQVSLGFQLEAKGDLLWVQGEVHSLVKLRNQDKKRLEVDGSAVMTDEVTILAYISKREDQIMSALDKAYKRLRKGKKVGKRG